MFSAACIPGVLKGTRYFMQEGTFLGGLVTSEAHASGSGGGKGGFRMSGKKRDVRAAAIVLFGTAGKNISVLCIMEETSNRV